MINTQGNRGQEGEWNGKDMRLGERFTWVNSHGRVNAYW